MVKKQLWSRMPRVRIPKKKSTINKMMTATDDGPEAKARTGKAVALEKEFLSPNQKKQLAKYIIYYSDFNVDQLKEILVRNRQSKTGSKKDLINKCAEGKLLGAPPNCPKCNGGKLNMNLKTGEYKCSGYLGFNDQHYNCAYKAISCETYDWQE